MQTVIKGRKITPEEKKYLLSLKQEDLDNDLLEDLFAYKKNNSPKFDPKDTFTLNSGEYKNSENLPTTVGRFIFNKFIFENTNYGKFIPYMNEEMHKKNIRKLEGTLGQLFLEDKINGEDMGEFYDRAVWLGFNMAKYLNASLTSDIITPLKDVENRKKELVEKYKNELESGNIQKTIEIENELMGIAKDELKDMADMQIYDSKCRGSFENSYKNSSIMRGVIKSLADPDHPYVSTSNLSDGIPPEEMPYYADILTQGSYSRAIGTQEGGYEYKKISAAFQNVILDEKDTDCNTELTLKIKLTNSNYNLFKYRYIKEGNKLIQLNDTNKSKYMDKIVNFRSPLYCKNDKICNKCAGDLLYQLGIKNLGLSSNGIGSSLLSLSLEAFHDLTIKLNEIDLDDYISPL